MKAEGRKTNGDWKTVTLDSVATIERSAIQPEAISQGTAYLGLEHIESGGKILGAKVEEEGVGEGVELGKGGAALGPQRLRPVQHLRYPPLLRQRRQGDFKLG